MSCNEWRETELGLIPIDWEVKMIGEIGKVVGGGTPNTKELKYWDGDISWITPKDLSGYNERYIYKGERSITKEGLENSSARLLPKGTVLFSSRAPIGYVAIAGKDLTTNQGFKSIICNDEMTCNMFVYYLMKYKKEEIEQIANGSTFKEISGKVLSEFKIALPPLNEQKAIAKILSDLDEKIEINNRINKVLEEIAQTIFRRWFVDFEFPNENGEPYKSSGGEMVESELGLIPKGWEYINLEDVVESANTGADAIKRAPIVEYDTGIKCVRVGDLSQGRDMSGWGYCEVSDEDYDKFALKKNDILITRTATIGLNMFVYEDIKAVFNNGLIRIKVKDEYNPLFIYQVLNYKDYYDHISKITGETSTRPNMKINYLLSYKFILPPKTIRNSFENTIKPIMYKINQNNKENIILAITRDTLLPKLMSGEIRVPIDESN
jgi:type I restriction enzyme S subunit